MIVDIVGLGYEIHLLRQEVSRVADNLEKLVEVLCALYEELRRGEERRLRGNEDEGNKDK